MRAGYRETGATTGRKVAFGQTFWLASVDYTSIFINNSVDTTTTLLPRQHRLPVHGSTSLEATVAGSRWDLLYPVFFCLARPPPRCVLRRLAYRERKRLPVGRQDHRPTICSGKTFSEPSYAEKSGAIGGVSSSCARWS